MVRLSGLRAKNSLIEDGDDGGEGHVVAAFMVSLDDDIVCVSSGGVTVRMPVRDISSQGRDATGVRVMNLDAGQTVASVAPIYAADEAEEPAPAAGDGAPPAE